VVGGILLRAACVAYAGCYDTVNKPEPGIGSPESAQGEGGRLNPRGPIPVHVRYRPLEIFLRRGRQSHCGTPFSVPSVTLPGHAVAADGKKEGHNDEQGGG
jgi:hypothetical protein